MATLATAFRPGLTVARLEHARQRSSGVLGVLENPERESEGDADDRLAELSVLCAHRCELEAVPATIAELHGLVRLDVGDNLLTELPGFVAALPRLRELYIYDNRIERLPALPALDVLDANRNRIAEVPALRGVAFVYLAETQLRRLPVVDGTVYLNVSDNLLESLSPAEEAGEARHGGVASLAELRAERCGLRELPPSIARFAGLRELSLRGNALEALPAVIGELRRLETLDLRGNRLDELPEELGALPALRKLDLRWNPLRRRPSWLAELSARGCAVYT